MRPATTELRMTAPAVTASLAALRDQVHERAVELGAGATVAGDLVLAVSELASNVVMHTGAERIGVDLDSDGRAWTLVVDGADGLDDVNPTGSPPPGQIGGRGLTIVNSVMDDVSLVEGPNGRLVRCVRHVDD